MCYTKPGPRCSQYARRVLSRMSRIYKENPTLDNYEKLMKAKDEFDVTPDGIGALRLAAEAGIDPDAAERYEWAVAMRQARLNEVKAKNLKGSDREHNEEPRQSLTLADFEGKTLRGLIFEYRTEQTLAEDGETLIPAKGQVIWSDDEGVIYRNLSTGSWRETSLDELAHVSSAILSEGQDTAPVYDIHTGVDEFGMTSDGYMRDEKGEFNPRTGLDREGYDEDGFHADTGLNREGLTREEHYEQTQM